MTGSDNDIISMSKINIWANIPELIMNLKLFKSTTWNEFSLEFSISFVFTLCKHRRITNFPRKYNHLLSILLKSSQWCNFASVCNYFVYTQSDLCQKCFLNTHKHILLATIRVHYFANFLPVIFAICLDLSFCSKHHNILDF